MLANETHCLFSTVVEENVHIKPTHGLWTKFGFQNFAPQLSLTKSSVDPRLNSLWRWRRTNKMPLSPWIILGRVNFLEVKSILDLLLLAIWSLPFLVHSWVKLIPLPFLRSHPWCRKWWRLHDMIPDIVDWRPSLFSLLFDLETHLNAWLFFLQSCDIQVPPSEGIFSAGYIYVEVSRNAYMKLDEIKKSNHPILDSSDVFCVHGD